MAVAGKGTRQAVAEALGYTVIAVPAEELGYRSRRMGMRYVLVAPNGYHRTDHDDEREAWMNAGTWDTDIEIALGLMPTCRVCIKQEDGWWHVSAAEGRSKSVDASARTLAEALCVVWLKRQAVHE